MIRRDNLRILRGRKMKQIKDLRKTSGLLKTKSTEMLEKGKEYNEVKFRSGEELCKVLRDRESVSM